MNDLTRMQCSEEIVVLGILRVVEEIMLRKPDALIVINSLLPMIDYRSEDVKMEDVVDFKADSDNSMKKNMEIEKAVKGFVGQKGAQAKNSASTGGTWKFVKGEKGQEANKGGARLLRTNKRKQKMAREDEAMEGPNLKKAMERRKKALDRRDKRMINKKFSDNERFRPKKPLSPFLPFLNKKALPPVWPAVHLINEKLKEFCAKHDSVSFFDATSIFAQDVGGGRHHLDNDLISPRGHPSELGFAVWEGRIMGRLDKIFKEMARPPPQVSLPGDDDDVDGEGEIDDVDESMTGSSAKAATGSEHVSAGKIAAEPDDPVKLPPREKVSADDSKEVEEEEKEIDDYVAEEDKTAIKGESSKKDVDDKGGEEEKAVVKSVKDELKKEDLDNGDEKNIKGKASKEEKKVTKVVSSEEDADDEEVKEEKTTLKPVKEDSKRVAANDDDDNVEGEEEEDE